MAADIVVSRDAFSRFGEHMRLKEGVKEPQALRRLVLLLLGCALCLSPIVPTLAGQEGQPEISAAEVRVSTPVYHPSDDFDFPLGTYTYEVSWQGIPAAEATVSIGREPGVYLAEATAKTYSGIDIFYRLRYRAEGVVSERDFAPVRVTFDKKENRRERFTSISYLDNGEILSVREKREKEAKDPPDVLQFNPGNFTLEPFSAAFLARSLDWEPGITRRFDTFNGKARYLIELACTEKRTIEFKGEEREVWVVEPKVSNLTKPDADKKLRKAEIFVSADRKREVLKVVSEVFIGSVTTKLESFIPAPEEPVRVAKQARSKEMVF